MNQPLSERGDCGDAVGGIGAPCAFAARPAQPRLVDEERRRHGAAERRSFAAARRGSRGLLVLVLAAAFAGCATTRREPPPPPTPALEEFEATAYSIEGKTASGARTREGICAADPTVLPLGSRIRVHEAGKYSGEYLVSDTGRAIKGRSIDIYLADDGEAKRFGRKKVRVEVLSSSK